MSHTLRRAHRWSGWPGAFCLRCGAGHRMEEAIADNAFDPYTNTWASPEYEQEYAESSCPVSDAYYMQRLREQGVAVGPHEEFY